MFVDSHCHIEDDDVVIRALDSGVSFMLNAGKDFDEMDRQLEMCQNYSCMFTSAGVHPDSAPDKLHLDIKDLVKASEAKKVVAIGECGLDYHYGKDYKNEQKEMFFRHVEVAGQTGLPLMIHQREAEDDMVVILEKGLEKYPHLTGVIHCFSSDKDFAKKMLNLGFYISASGIITFKSAETIREVFKDYPSDRILIETDSPYLAPVPFRGKVNEPMYISKTAQCLAQIRGLTTEEIAHITERNFFNLYQKAQK